MKPLVLRTAAAWGVLQSAVNAIARSLAVVTWQGVATVLGLSAVWAWSVTVHVLPSAWNDNWLFVWITERLSGEFACMIRIAVVMALPLLMVSRFGRRMAGSAMCHWPPPLPCSQRLRQASCATSTWRGHTMSRSATV